MNYSILLEGERLSQVLKELENEADTAMVSMDNFNKLWNNIYESYKKNNIEIPKALDSLVISIYNDWKDKPNLIEQIEESFDKILQELNIAKKKKILNKNIIAEISQEVQNISRAVLAFEIDKNAIDHLAKECKKNKPSKNLGTSAMIFWLLYNKRLGINTVAGIASALLIWNVYHDIESDSIGNHLIERVCLAIPVIIMKYDYISRKIKSRKLSCNLSKLSQSSIEMNKKFRNFGLLVSNEIGRVKIDTSTSKNREETEICNAIFDFEIDSLIKITQKLSVCFENFRQQTLQNESNARKLVLKCNPDFLIKE